jgi:periplasmic iron binding protein
MRLSRSLSLAGIGLLGLSLQSAIAAEYPIGEPQLVSGMEIAAVYLQPIEMEPEGMMAPASETDIHLEADIHATADNANGFAEGDWLPNLSIDYRLTKVDDGQVVSGTLMTMVASDGPHYGDNVKLAGPGKYKLKYTIYPPNAKENAIGQHFGRHIDRATGVRPWFKTLDVEWEFTYAGVGKKGGY